MVPSQDYDVAQSLDTKMEPGNMSPTEFTSASQDGQASEQLEVSSVISGAPWPPLRIERQHSVLPFPVKVFPPALQVYCQEVAEAMLAPVDFVGASMLAVAGAAIGQSVNLEVKRGWIEAPVLFLFIVAPPGSAKTPVIRAVVKPMTNIEERFRSQWAEVRRRWEESKKTPRRHAEEPSDTEASQPDEVQPPLAEKELPLRRAIVKDITRESLVTILADNPRGVLCAPDEAVAWVGSFNEYKARAGADRQFWLSIWTCESVSVDRKGSRESIHIRTPFVAVLGGLQPDMLTSLKDERGRDDGLMDRILFVYPEEFPEQYWTENEISVDAEREWSTAISRLFDMPMSVEGDRLQPHVITLTTELKRSWAAWWDAHALEMAAAGFSEHYAGAWSKMRAYAARLVLILSRLRWACDQSLFGTWSEDGNELAQTTDGAVGPPIGSVEAEDVQGAIKLVNYFKSHLLRVTHQAIGGIGHTTSDEVLEWIKRKGLTQFREADVKSDLRRFREKPQLLRDALEFLIDAGAIRQIPEECAAGKRGPKPTPTYEVRPDLFNAPEITADSAICPPAPPSVMNAETIGLVGANQQKDQRDDWDSALGSED